MNFAPGGAVNPFAAINGLCPVAAERGQGGESLGRRKGRKKVKREKIMNKLLRPREDLFYFLLFNFLTRLRGGRGRAPALEKGNAKVGIWPRAP